METILNNRVRVYRDKYAVTLLGQLVADYLSIWESESFVRVLTERWMKVPPKPGWEAKVSAIKLRVYLMGTKACQLVDKTFDEMHCFARFKFKSEHTLFRFSVFVVWKLNAKDKRKGRAVVNIQKLNNMVLPEFYLLPHQSEIIANVQGCTNLAVLDAAFFFYQWLFHPDHHFMFTVVTHCGQKTFQVPIMGYINSVKYVQREIDNILQEVRAWARAYVNDIICKARSLSDLLKKLRILFKIFLKYNISIKPTKSFFNYPNVRLLGQQVNFLGLTTLEKKLWAIKHLTYLEILGVLKSYLGLTGCLHNYIHFYA